MVKKQTSKKTAASKSSSLSDVDRPSSVDPPTSPQNTKDQQRLLNIFSEAFDAVLSAETFPVLLQEIKQALFNRDFNTPFGREDYLETYAARWSPTRALCYASVMQGISEYIEQITSTEQPGGDDTQFGPETSLTPGRNIKMLSIGGCAAEHVAFASYLHDTNYHGTLTLLDSAPWSHVASLLQNQLTTPPAISKYASAAVKAANRALLHDQQLSMTLSQNDILSMDKDELAGLVGAEPLIVTLLFTLNELYTNGGIGKTTKLLKSLGELLPNGSLLLVVDSPGSYSEAAVGKEKKRYPMQWLLNHTLLETKTPAQSYQWSSLESQDSIWFRLPDGISYPIQLENMRYQIHLYRREEVSYD